MVYIGADHGGYELKAKLTDWLTKQHIAFKDLGATQFNPEDDYPDYIVPVAEIVSTTPENLGVVIGRSGNGEAICANKVKNIRAAVCLNVEMARKAKMHNNANILSLGADYITEDEAKKILQVFLQTKFSEEQRHIRRIDKIRQLENQQIG